MDFDGISNNPRAVVHRAFVLAENVNDLFALHGVPGVFDLLSIDIDGNDFWVWREIRARARVVVIEYNSTVPVDQSRAIVYEPMFRSGPTDYFGASLLALARLGRLKGYTLVYCEHTGVNAFFVADEALPEGFEPRPIEEIYRPANFFGQGWGWPPDPTRKMVDPFEGPNWFYSRIDV
jgi:hypothetical protein